MCLILPFPGSSTWAELATKNMQKCPQQTESQILNIRSICQSMISIQIFLEYWSCNGSSLNFPGTTAEVSAFLLDVILATRRHTPHELWVYQSCFSSSWKKSCAKGSITKASIIQYPLQLPNLTKLNHVARRSRRTESYVFILPEKQNGMANMVTLSARQVHMLHWEGKAETTFAKHACQQDQRWTLFESLSLFSPSISLLSLAARTSILRRLISDAQSWTTWGFIVHVAHWCCLKYLAPDELVQDNPEVPPKKKQMHAWERWCRDACRGNWHPTSRSRIGRPKCQHPRVNLFIQDWGSLCTWWAPSHTNHTSHIWSWECRMRSSQVFYLSAFEIWSLLPHEFLENRSSPDISSTPTTRVVPQEHSRTL